MGRSAKGRNPRHLGSFSPDFHSDPSYLYPSISESQSYVLASAQVGSHNEKRESYGHSIIIDPWGNVLKDAQEESPCIACAEIGKKT